MSSYIKQIQTTLKQAGFYKGEIDGIAGRMTVQAVNFAMQNKAVNSDEVQAVLAQHKSHPSNNPPIATDKPLVGASGFVLGERSLKNLQGVHPDLVKVVKRAIKITGVDFRITEGVRTKERQAQLVKQGKSKTMNSRHLTGDAVDVVAIVDGEVSWDLNHYYAIAKAFAQAGGELGVNIRWGGSWSVISGRTDSPQDWVKAYKAERKKLGKKEFLDGVHFELPA